MRIPRNLDLKKLFESQTLFFLFYQFYLKTHKYIDIIHKNLVKNTETYYKSCVDIILQTFD